MQPGTTTTFPSAPVAPSAHALPAGLSPRRSVALIVTVILILALIIASFSWLAWAGQRGLETGYPKPTVHIGQIAAGNHHTYENIQFSAQSTGRDLKYTWTFDDSAASTDTSSSSTATGTREGQNISYAFTNPGSHTVIVTVIDAMGQKSEDKMNITIYPPVPAVTFTVDTSSYSSYVYFDVDTSALDPSTTISGCTWDFGDGKTDSETSEYYCTSTYHYYSNNGTYKVTLVVTDSYGQQSQPYTQIVTVKD